MPYSALPTWPLILFGVLEPVALVWGYATALRTPEQYYADQTPNAELAKLVFTPQALSLTLQLGNVLLLLAAMAIICCWTTHADVTQKYLIAVALADLGHIYAAYRGLGDTVFWDVTQWNEMAYGNIGASSFLHINRWMTVAGLFGRLGAHGDRSKKNK
ncbi:hypothetical protein LTR72_005167 [Exophiala xenobiotica]|nr:hypothetical protein LTR92_001335 [Exophiala xenobiotica]KAK5209435.1 hypothetical protein LTR41_004971 [Exophiala xenobiotica]KAK5223781.1 hypothetical protein LTR72_005167 [Exophiala xenobiotica]KAK5289182.1 hypothetical protein LTR14_007433 [Exophiala xenobiotica]KAK5373603.1 hypothetical protein LTS13_005802 [Exophiala xenobiotica]